MVAGFGMRALSFVLTVAYLLTSIVACSHIPGDQADQIITGVPVGTSRLGLSISVLQSRPEISLSLQQVTEEYRASSPVPVSFAIQTVADPSEYRIALRSKLAAGTPPDLFHLLSAGDTAQLQDHLEPLEDLPWIGEPKGNLLDSVTVGHEIFGVPYSLEGTGLVVNRAIFEAADIPLGEINDFESMSTAFYELRDQIAVGELADLFPGLEAVTDVAALDSGWLQSTLGELLITESFLSPTQAHYSATARMPMAEASGSYVNLLARCSPHHQTWSDLVKVPGNRLTVEGIASGRIAAALLTTEAAADIPGAEPDMADKLDFLPVYLPGMEQGIYYAGTSAWWAVSAHSEDSVKQGVKGFLTWLYNSPEGNQAFLEQFGAIYPYASYKQSPMGALESRLDEALGQQTALPRLMPECPSHYSDDVLVAEIRQYFCDYNKEWSQTARACEEGWAAYRDPR